MADLKTLTFRNPEAIPIVTDIRCDAASAPTIMTWYGAFHAGDKYKVAFNGKRLKIDHNGDLLGALS